MELWRAIRVGILAKVTFPAVKADSPIREESVWLLVTGAPSKPAGPTDEFVGEVTEAPSIDIGLTVGATVSLPLAAVEEVKTR